MFINGHHAVLLYMVTECYAKPIESRNDDVPHQLQPAEIYAMGDNCHLHCSRPCTRLAISFPIQQQQKMGLLSIGHLRKAMDNKNDNESDQSNHLYLWQCPTPSSGYRSAAIPVPYAATASTWLLMAFISAGLVLAFAVTFHALFRYIERREVRRAQGETISLISSRWK